MQLWRARACTFRRPSRIPKRDGCSCGRPGHAETTPRRSGVIQRLRDDPGKLDAKLRFGQCIPNATVLLPISRLFQQGTASEADVLNDRMAKYYRRVRMLLLHTTACSTTSSATRYSRCWVVRVVHQERLPPRPFCARVDRHRTRRARSLDGRGQCRDRLPPAGRTSLAFRVESDALGFSPDSGRRPLNADGPRAPIASQVPERSYVGCVRRADSGPGRYS
jgi:hypothetical protein